MARIYLASPYSDPDPEIRKQRIRLAEAKTVELIEAGNKVFSPVACSGRLLELGCEQDDNYWYDWSMSFLEHWADVLGFYRIDGFERSKGMSREWDYAYARKMPVIYL